MRLIFKDGPLDGDHMPSHDSFAVGQVVNQEYMTFGNGKQSQPYTVESIDADVVTLKWTPPQKEAAPE